jgi:hypothetical protein
MVHQAGRALLGSQVLRGQRAKREKKDSKVMRVILGTLGLSDISDMKARWVHQVLWVMSALSV